MISIITRPSSTPRYQKRLSGKVGVGAAVLVEPEPVELADGVLGVARQPGKVLAFLRHRVPHGLATLFRKRLRVPVRRSRAHPLLERRAVAIETRRPNRPLRPTRARVVVFLALAFLQSCDWIAGLGNDAPLATTAIQDQIVEVDDTVWLDLGLHFSDPDGDLLTYSAVSAAPGTVAATEHGGVLSFAGVAAGRAVVTVTARDPEGLTAVQGFEVTVPNRAPEPLAAIPDGNVYVDSTLAIDAADYFADPDGDDLEYSATSSDPTRAAVAVSESVVSLTGMAVGSATVTVTVRDPHGLAAEQSFVVTVPNRAPVAVGAIADREVRVDSVAALDLAAYFADPDRDSLTYAVASSDSARALATVAGSRLTVSGVAKGVATLTVTARDPHGLAAEQRFVVTVPNRGPVVMGAIADLEVFVGDWVVIDVAGHFADPDGDALKYASASSDTARVVVVVSDGVATVTGVSVGSAMVTVTARDPEGLSAEQVFGVTMPNRAPEPLGAIADREVYVGDSTAVNVAAYFSEPDGEELAYAAESSGPATAAVAVSGGVVTVAAVAVGEATVTVTARDPHGLEAERRFLVTVPNRAPEAVGVIADREVKVDGVAALDIADRFTDPDGHELEYAAVSSDPSRAVATFAGSALTVTGVAKGVATVTVTARDPHGLEARQRFIVTVPNRGPVVMGAIADLELFVGDWVVIDVAPHFADPDGDALRYTAVSSDTARVVVVSGGVVTVTGLSVGSARVTVTARDPEGLSAEQAFGVTMPNRAPKPRGAIPDRWVYAGDSAGVNVARYFSEPDGETLVYAAESSGPATATVSVSGGVVTVAGMAVGEVTVTVTARDPHGLEARQRFVVTVSNRAPVAVGEIADRELDVGEGVEIDVADRFTDPDGDELDYAAASSDPSRVVATIAGSALTVTGVARGRATVTVTARDPHGLEARQWFVVTVPNRAPVAVGQIADREVYVGEGVEIDVADRFTDPDGDQLDFTAASSDPSKVVAAIAGSALTVTGVDKGSATVTVTARDPGGLEARQLFVVTVANRAPVAVGEIADREVYVGDRVDINVAAHFSDPDGDALDYAAVSSDTARLVAAVRGGVVTVTGVSVGSARVTVTASDAGGLSAEQVFRVTMPNRAPRPLGAIADREVEVDSVATLDLVDHFADPDGEVLEYAATSSDPSRVAAAIAGSALTVTGVATGSATVTVTARDPHGLEAEQRFVVTVGTGPNRAPVAVGEIAPRVVQAGSSITVNVADAFTDPDGDALAYSAISSDPTRVATAMAGSTLTVTGVATGSATVTVTARDPHGLEAEQRFVVTVGTVPNRAPVAVGAIAPRVVQAGSSITVNVEDAFTDPDGDALAYSATSSDPTKVATAIAGSTLTVTGVATGSATVTVTARDPHGLEAEQRFVVTVGTVPNRSPEAVGTITDRTVKIDQSFSVDVSPYFSDPDGDALTHTAASSDTARVTVGVSGSSVTVTGQGVGTATVTVTATDPDGLSATQRFVVTVDPVVSGSSDLVVRSPVARPGSLGPGETFVLSAVVHNQGAGDASSGTTLRYYRSANATIDRDDTEIGTDAVPLLGPSRSSPDSLSVTAPSALGTYHYGACVDAVTNESSTTNNCSVAVAVVVVRANQSPRAVGTIPDRTARVGDNITIDAASYFSDPDNDNLVYAASSLRPFAATVGVSGSDVLVTGRDIAETTITVTATDPGGLSATQRFEVWVVPDDKLAVTNSLPDLLNIGPGYRYAAHLPDVFEDQFGDSLAWATSSSNVSAVGSAISNDSIIVNTVALGSATVTVIATDPGGLSAADTFEVSVVTADFDLDLHFTTNVADSHRVEIRKARDTWESVLAGTELLGIAFDTTVSCFGMSVDLGVVDDHVAFVDIDSIDGRDKIIGHATYCHVRDSDGTPVVSGVRLDEADIDAVFSNGRLKALALHEFAHGLGFHSNYWNDLNLLNVGTDPHFKGPLALAAFNAAGGTTYTGKKVPLTIPVTAHWRNSVFGSELMSPRYHGTNPLSAITIQAMADIGYVVDVSLAENFELPTEAPPDLAADAPPWELDLRGDVVHGPVIVIDANGRIVRVDPPPPGAPPPPVHLWTVPVDPPETDAPRIWVRSPPGRAPPRR